MKTPEWNEVQEAVTKLNRMKIEKLGKAYGKDRLEQDGVQPHEVAQQILSLAPGESPHIGPLLLDLAAKLRESNSEWH